MTSEEELAAALYAALTLMHPVYGSTATWRGGIGGAAMTQGCSFIDPPPHHQKAQEALETVMYKWYREHKGDTGKIVNAAKALMGEPHDSPHDDSLER